MYRDSRFHSCRLLVVVCQAASKGEGIHLPCPWFGIQHDNKIRRLKWLGGARVCVFERERERERERVGGGERERESNLACFKGFGFPHV